MLVPLLWIGATTPLCPQAHNREHSTRVRVPDNATLLKEVEGLLGAVVRIGKDVDVVGERVTEVTELICGGGSEMGETHVKKN